jgi:hypothetical protein
MSKRDGDPGYAPNWCIHYRSRGQHETCEKGVRYDSFAPADRTFHRSPCFTAGRHARAHCDHRRLPTPEEIAAHKEWQQESWGRLSKVLAGIRPWRERWAGKSRQEVVPCPACGGRLRLSIAASNGHVHGRCESPDCVSWME